jgi:hypothetical protein
MEFSEEQIKSLKKIVPDLKLVQEGGYTYFYIEGLKLPEGCSPNIVNALLCPSPLNGYQSRLYFSSQISGLGSSSRNWNGRLRAIGQNWFAISWQTKSGLSLVEMLSIHLKALKK